MDKLNLEEYRAQTLGGNKYSTKDLLLLQLAQKVNEIIEHLKKETT